jgi:hypothetical protein
MVRADGPTTSASELLLLLGYEPGCLPSVLGRLGIALEPETLLHQIA